MILFVGDDERMNGILPAARYGFILSTSTLNESGASAKRKFESFLSLVFISDAVNIHTRSTLWFCWAKGHRLYCRLLGGPHL